MHKLANQVCSLREEIEELKADIRLHKGLIENLEHKIDRTYEIYDEMEDLNEEIKNACCKNQPIDVVKKLNKKKVEKI